MEIGVNRLKKIEAFKDVPEDQLAWFIENARLRSIKEGGKLFDVGDPIDKLYVLLEGKIEIKLKRGQHYQSVGLIEPGGISGFLPYSRATTAVGEGLVLEEVQILEMTKEQCKEMSLKHYDLTSVFVHEMTSRTREFAKRNIQAEKMMALGKLSAGLAHELNNPASAILRSAQSLKKHLANVPEKFKAVMSMKVNSKQVDDLNDIIFSKLGAENTLSLTERSDLEDDLEFWLEDQDRMDCLGIIDSLVDYNFQESDMDQVRDIVGQENLNATLNWISNVLTTEKMVEEIEEASNRISGLVKSIKVYTHMDNAPEKQRADIRKGINGTLTMLNHKLKKKQIAVELEFVNDFASPCVMIGEMNQVWTNLIDNAIDAMEQNGKLLIKGTNEGSTVCINVIDNGKGIPQENISRIFDPFFTTKGIGEGTGMGLEVVYRIIQQHKGTISVTSEPGKTKFEINLPID